MIESAKVHEAYAGIQTPEGVDLGVMLGDLVDDEGENLLVVALGTEEFEAITQRILTLQELARQNALVKIPDANDPNAWVQLDD